MNKYNELLFELVIKLCKGKISEKELKSKTYSPEILDIRNFFSPISKAFLTITEDIIMRPDNYCISSA